MASEPGPAPHSPHRLRLVVFLSGTATMALQMCAVRLLAPWVGASSIVWATIIGLSLLAMSLGYVLGGRLADRRADGPTLARTLAGAAILVAVVPLVAPVLLPHATLGVESAGWSDLVGSAVGFGVLFLVPAMLLGVTPPYAIRLALPGIHDTGRTAGRLYALSTIGSILGTLLTALVLVQWIGTRATLLGIAVTLVVAAVLAARSRAVHAPPTRERVASAAATGIITTGLAAAIVFVEGMAMMATEMSVARLVAPFFGASHAVWAVIIAVVMGSIALGSRLGGRAADRWASLAALTTLLACAGVVVAALPFAAAPVMRASTGGIDEVAVGTVIGSFLATMAMLVVPVTLLGMVPPWVLRLAVPDVERSGSTAGRMYALSTAGALVGTFASVLWLIPAVGTRRTMLLFAVALVLVALVLVVRSRPRAAAPQTALVTAALVLVVALAFAPTGLVKPLDDARVLDERESRYQFIQVVERDDGRRLLQLNEGWAVHSIYDPQTVLTGGIWDHFLVLPALLERPGYVDAPDNPPARRELGVGSQGAYDQAVCIRDARPGSACTMEGYVNTTDSTSRPRMLVIGSAAGTARRAYATLRPSVQMDSVELDGEVTQVGRRWFDMEGRVTGADGRPFLQRATRRWDVIHVDAYRQPYIPFYLTTREFFELASDRLDEGGVMSINVGSTPDDQRINEAVAATMRDVFPIVARYRAEEFNEVIVGVKDRDVTIDQLRARIGSSDLAVGDSPVFLAGDPGGDDTGGGPVLDGELLDERRELGALFDAFAQGMREVDPDPDRVLTDDRAPVEWMTDRMIFGEAG